MPGRCQNSIKNKTKALLSLDLRSSWERQTIKVVKISINVAGGDKHHGGNEAGPGDKLWGLPLCSSLTVCSQVSSLRFPKLQSGETPFAPLRARSRAGLSDIILEPIGGAPDCAELAVQRRVMETGAAKLLQRRGREVKAAAEGWGGGKLWDVTGSEHNGLHHKYFSWSAA